MRRAASHSHRAGLEESSLTRARVLLLAYAALLAGFTLTIQRMSPHITARLATIDSLVERGSFAIEASSYSDTVDKVRIDGHYYSHQPPATAVAGAVVYYPLYLLGMRLGPRESLSYVILTFGLNGIATLAGMVFFFLALRWSTLPPMLHLPVAASLACGTLLLPFSTTLTSHSFCAALMAIGLYYYLLSQESTHTRGAAFWSGMAFSLSAAADHALLAFYGLFAVCILLRRQGRGRALWFFLPSLLTIVPTFAYYYAIGHSIKPFAARPELFAYPGSPWLATGESTARLTGGSWNSWAFAARYGFLLLLGKRGFLLYNPTACIALYGLARTVWTKAKFWREALAVSVGSAAIIAFYAFSSANFSGAAYSIRWFVPLLPLWWYFGPPAALENIRIWPPWKKFLLAGLCAMSLFYALAGAMNPWPEEWRGLSMPLSNITDTLNRPLFVPH